MEAHFMGISRKKVLKNIAGLRRTIEYHLNTHIPLLINESDQGLIEYWRKEVNARFAEMEQWASRLSKNEDILADVAQYRLQLDELLNTRLDELNN